MTAPTEQQPAAAAEKAPETNPPAAPSPIPPATRTEPETSGDTDWQAKYKEMQTHAATWEERAKKNQTELQKIEDQKLSDLERAQKELAERDTRLAALQRQADQAAVALEKGLPAELAATLSGASRDEMVAHAERMIAWRDAAVPRGAQPNPGFGARPVTPEQASDAEFQQYMQFFPQHGK